MKKRSYRDGAFFASEKVSPRIEKTPEGYLICHDVPISRVGSFPYSGNESGIASARGMSRAVMRRTEEELFNPETIQSFEGKPVTVGHSSFVSPRNWRERSVGITQNVRRGDGADADKLLADLLITDARGIDAVESGRLREVSCGYDANPVDDGGGFGHQVGIVGNHVALVERGRCGNACMIRDEEMSRISLKNTLRRLFKDGDEEQFNAELDNLDVKPLADAEDAPAEQEASVTVESLSKEVAEIKAILNQLLEASKPAVTDEDDEKAEEKTPEEEQQIADEEEDAQPAEEQEKEEVFSDADDIAEGVKKPVADSAKGGYTKGALNRLRRVAMKQGGITQFGDVDSMSNATLKASFHAAALMARSARNPSATGFRDSAPRGRTNADLNTIFKNYWSK